MIRPAARFGLAACTVTPLWVVVEAPAMLLNRLSLTTNWPLLTVVGPLYEFDEDVSVSTPAPVFVRPAAPLNEPAATL